MLYELLSQQRSGSTYMYGTLAFYLKSCHDSYDLAYKHLDKLDEPFINSKKKDFNPNPIIDSIENFLNVGNNVVIKNHIRQMANLEKYHIDAYNRLLDIPKKRIVLLRHDQFQKTVSSIIAKHYDIWGDQPDDMGPIYIKPDIFRLTYEEIICDYNLLTSTITSDDIIINYEDLEFWPKKDFYNLNFSDQLFNSLPEFFSTKKNKPKDKTVVNLAELEHIYKTEFV